jgi:hypothetical protein
MASTELAPDEPFRGTLHVFVAFDWGEEMDLDAAQRLVPAEVHALQRRRRTPSSIAYRPSPLKVTLPSVPLQLPELGPIAAPAEATIFDFAAVSTAFHIPFTLSRAGLTKMAGWLADSTPLIQAARAVLTPLHGRLFPALHDPQWSDDLSEEYLVFQLQPSEALSPAALLDSGAAWLASLARLEADILSDTEIHEAVRLRLSYSPSDLFVPDWAGAVLVDADCDETLQTIEFANLQLLEYRHIDDRLDVALAAASKLTDLVKRSRLPFWRSLHIPLRTLGELRVEANGLFERTGNALKLLGDQYLARVYRLAATRFHLKEWERNIQRKLDVAEGVYQIVSDQSASYRTEFLEIIVIFLIMMEIILSILKH